MQRNKEEEEDVCEFCGAELPEVEAVDWDRDEVYYKEHVCK